MKIYRCDICGKELAQNDPHTFYAEQAGSPYSGSFGAVIRGKDVCPMCIEIGKLIDFDAVLTLAWKEEVKRLESCNKIDNAPAMKEDNNVL